MIPERRHNNIFTRIFGFIIGCVAVNLFNCSNSFTGGNSSETTNVAVVTEDGYPVVSALVKLVNGENWSYNAVNNYKLIVDSMITGPGGIISFDSLPETSCNLQIDCAGSGIFIRDFCAKGKIASGTDTIRLQKYAILSGTCSSDSSASSVMLEGTVYSSTVNNASSFSFAAVAPGVYPMMFSLTSGNIALAGSAVLAAGQTITVNAPSLSFSSLLVDDFENNDSTSVLGQFTRASWYNYVDTANGGMSTVERALQTGGPQGNFCLTARVILKTNPLGAWAGIGIPLGTKKSDWDISAMTRISFWAKGRNTIRISIESPLVDSINNNWPDFGKAISLDSNWKYYQIPVDSLELTSSPALTKGITWAMAAKRIYRIEFEGVSTSSVADTIQMQIDDIRLDGVSASDLFKQMGNMR